ncbi:MAG: hypothetical protein JJE09_11030 [Bacteroidia bacterium]|nr:hypothetical protein [Bacteroidia bacterium]
MKKLIIALSLLVSFFLTGHAQTPSDSTQHKGKNHHGHISQDKGDRHHNRFRSFHGHHHHGKDLTKGDPNSHKGSRRQGEKQPNENK